LAEGFGSAANTANTEGTCSTFGSYHDPRIPIAQRSGTSNMHGIAEIKDDQEAL